jgi:hypothetical protein
MESNFLIFITEESSGDGCIARCCAAGDLHARSLPAAQGTAAKMK